MKKGTIKRVLAGFVTAAMLSGGMTGAAVFADEGGQVLVSDGEVLLDDTLLDGGDDVTVDSGDFSDYSGDESSSDGGDYEDPGDDGGWPEDGGDSGDDGWDDGGDITIDDGWTDTDDGSGDQDSGDNSGDNSGDDSGEPDPSFDDGGVDSLPEPEEDIYEEPSGDTESEGSTDSEAEDGGVSSLPALVTESLPAIVMADNQTASGAVTLSVKLDESFDSIALGAAPNLYVYLEQTSGGEGTAAAAPAAYLKKLAYDEKGGTFSAKLSSMTVGTYSVKFYEPKSGKAKECESATKPDSDLFDGPFGVDGKYAGGVLKLTEVEESVTIEAAGGSIELAITSVASLEDSENLRLGIYKLIDPEQKSSGVDFSFTLKASDGETAGATVDTLTTADNVPKAGLSQMFKKNPLVLLAETDVYYQASEGDVTGESKADYTKDSSTTLFHAKVEKVFDHFSITKLEIKPGSKSKGKKMTFEAKASEGGDGLVFSVSDTSNNYAYTLYAFDTEAGIKWNGKYSDSEKVGEAKYESNTFTFEPVKLPADGKKYYAIVEKMDDTVYPDHTIVIRVDANGSWAVLSDGARFVNTYKHVPVYEPVQVPVYVTFKVTGDPPTTEKFSFKYKKNGTSTGKTYSVPGDGELHKVFTSTIKAPGKVTYSFDQVKGTLKGYTYDTTTYDVVITAKADEKTEKLTATITINGKSVDEASVVFTNKYENSTKVYIGLVGTGEYKSSTPKDGTLAIKKIGEKWTPDGGWHEVTLSKDGTYTITNPKAASGYNKAAKVSFTLKDGVVTCNGEKTNYIRVKCTEKTGSFNFTNVNKLSGAPVNGSIFDIYKIKATSATSSEYQQAYNDLKAGKFVSSEMEAAGEKQSGGNGAVSFSKLAQNTFYVITQKSCPGTYQPTPEGTYAIIYTQYKDNKFAPIVTYSGSGTLGKSDSGKYLWYQYPTRVAVYMKNNNGAILSGVKMKLTDTATGEVVKTWESGKSAVEFRGQLVRGRTYKLELVNQLKGYTETAPKTFTVSDETPGAIQKVELIATKSTTPTPTATATPTSSGGGSSKTSSSSSSSTSTTKRTQLVDVRVKKTWKDANGNEVTWPDGATAKIQLYRNNEAVEDKVLTLTSDQQISAFKDLPKYDSYGLPYTYTIREIDDPDAYVPEGVTGTLAMQVVDSSNTATTSSGAATASSDGSGNTTFTNSAKTGDNNPILPLIALMSLAAVAIVIVLMKRRRS